MQLTKLNLFQKCKDKMPIGLSSLGLKKKPKKIKSNIYPNFFKLGKVSPVAN